MKEWITFGMHQGRRPEIDALVAAVLSTTPALARVTGADGGLKRLDLIATLAPVARAHGLALPMGESFALPELDLISVDHRVAISAQAGRARTNNGALRAVLAAAAHPGVSWLILLVPDRYKAGPTAMPIREDLRRLADAPGVALDLRAVHLSSF